MGASVAKDCGMPLTTFWDRRRFSEKPYYCKRVICGKMYFYDIFMCMTKTEYLVKKHPLADYRKQLTAIFWQSRTLAGFHCTAVRSTLY